MNVDNGLFYLSVRQTTRFNSNLFKSSVSVLGLKDVTKRSEPNMSELFNDVLGSDAGATETAVNETTETVTESTVETEIPPTETQEEITETSEEQTDESLTDEEKLLKELEQDIEDEKAPAFYRNKLKASLDSFGKFKTERTEEVSRLNTELETLKTSRAYDEQDLTRYKTYEEKVNTLSSIAATPEQILETLAELNPRSIPQVQQKLIWSAIEKPDGTPDYDNLQAIVDKFTTQTGAVQVKDVLNAISAIENGTVDPLDFDEFYTEEDRNRAMRIRETEQASIERQRILDEELKATETRSRQGVVGNHLNSMTGQIRSHADTLMNKFGLAPTPDDLPEVKEWKSDIMPKLASAISQAESVSPHFKEIATAVKLLTSPTKVSTVDAEREINAFFNNPIVQSKIGAGLAEINKAVEKVLLKEARQHKILQKGLEAMAKEKLNGTRPVPKTSSETVDKKLTGDDVKKMSNQQRYEAGLEAFSNQLRQMKVS